VDEYAAHPNAMPDWVASGLHAFMGTPINIGVKKIGVLSVYNRHPLKKFSARDLSLMEAVAQEVAIAIHNARLYVDLQKELDERKRAELAREAMYKDLEAKNAELERFTYTVSHDLKSPLVTIGGFIGIIEEDIRKGNIDRVPRSTGRIREAARKMRQLLDELLELSRIGRLANPAIEISFGELAREAVELVQGELTARQVEVKIEADLPWVFVDRIRIVEVLQNLISNAIKFMGERTDPLIEICVRKTDQQPVFYVRDNGIGIAPEYHERIFGLFNKLDLTSDGTGIGLALVKRIIEVHGGTIWVESALGKGATFFFTLADKNQQEQR
jgi:signal transduction histidine kinase